MSDSILQNELDDQYLAYKVVCRENSKSFSPATGSALQSIRYKINHETRRSAREYGPFALFETEQQAREFAAALSGRFSILLCIYEPSGEKSLWKKNPPVPLMVRGPGVAPGDDSSAASLIDVLPTLCALARLDCGANVDGLQLPRTGAVDESRFERRTLYAIITKPIHRAEFVVGKFLGLVVTLAVNVAIMGAGVLVLASSMEARVTWELLLPVGLTFLKLMVVTAIAVLFSTFSTPTLSAICTLALVVAGSLAYDLKLFAATFGGQFLQVAVTAVYLVLPFQ